MLIQSICRIVQQILVKCKIFFSIKFWFAFLILDLKTNAISFGSGKKINDWTCSLHINITRTSITTVVRECIERNFVSGCFSTGNINETFMECFCEIDGCNNYVHTFPNTTTTSTTISTTSSTTTTTEQATTATDNGSCTLRQSSVVLTSCCFLAYSLIRAFHFL